MGVFAVLMIPNTSVLFVQFDRYRNWGSEVKKVHRNVCG